MIITVTLNPAMDKTVTVQSLRVGALNRVGAVQKDAGGKGINVSKTLKSLGGESIATGLLGGDTGEQIARRLENCQLAQDFTQIAQETRTNLKVIDEIGGVTELNEPGPVVSDAELCDLQDRLYKKAGEGDVIVLSGSIPRGVPATCYADLIRALHQRGAQVFLDADGELFANAMEAAPDMIKPNLDELEQYAETKGIVCKESGVVARAAYLGGKCRELGVREVLVSLGSLGAVFLSDELSCYAPALPVKAVSTVGAGDAMVAAYLYGREQKMTAEERVRLCMAVSAGAVTTAGTAPAEPALVRELQNQVQVKDFSSGAVAY